MIQVQYSLSKPMHFIDVFFSICDIPTQFSPSGTRPGSHSVLLGRAESKIKLLGQLN